MKLHLIRVTSNGLKDSERGVRTLDMVQVVGGRQLLEIRKGLKKFKNWWPETFE
jgi:hypothetical protein